VMLRLREFLFGSVRPSFPPYVNLGAEPFRPLSVLRAKELRRAYSWAQHKNQGREAPSWIKRAEAGQLGAWPQPSPGSDQTPGCCRKTCLSDRPYLVPED